MELEFREITAALNQDEQAAQASYLDIFTTGPHLRRLTVVVSLGMGVNWVGEGVLFIACTTWMEDEH